MLLEEGCCNFLSGGVPVPSSELSPTRIQFAMSVSIKLFAIIKSDTAVPKRTEIKSQLNY